MLLLHYLDLFIEIARVVSADLGPVPVFQRRDDATAVRIVLRVGARYQHHVQREHDAVALYLHVALLHQVEEADLDALGEVRQLVDTEDASVGARDESIVNSQLVGQVAPLGYPNGVDLANQVRNADVWRRQLLGVPLRAGHPAYGNVVAALGHSIFARPADGGKGVVVELAALDRWDAFVEQIGHVAYQPRLRLTPFAEENDVLSGEDRVLKLWDHGVLESHYAGEQLLALPYPGDEVLSDLLLDGKDFVTGLSQLAYGGRSRVRRHG